MSFLKKWMSATQAQIKQSGNQRKENPNSLKYKTILWFLILQWLVSGDNFSFMDKFEEWAILLRFKNGKLLIATIISSQPQTNGFGFLNITSLFSIIIFNLIIKNHYGSLPVNCGFNLLEMLSHISIIRNLNFS